MVDDENDAVKREDVSMVKAAPTTESEGRVSNSSGTGLLASAPEEFCRFSDVPF